MYSEANVDGLLSHSDNGELLCGSIIVLDFNIKGDETTYKTYVNIGENNLTLVLFTVVRGGNIVGWIHYNEEGKVPTNLALEDDDVEETELDLHKNLDDNFKITNKPWDGGETLIDSYRVRAPAPCGLYVATNSGFHAVTFVTFLAGGGVGAQELALLLTVSTAPWS